MNFVLQGSLDNVHGNTMKYFWPWICLCDRTLQAGGTNVFCEWNSKSAYSPSLQLHMLVLGFEKPPLSKNIEIIMPPFLLKISRSLKLRKHTLFTCFTYFKVLKTFLERTLSP